MIQPDDFQASRHYQANFAVQRDIGFNTVVEVAYVGNWGRHYYQGKTVNNIPVDAYARRRTCSTTTRSRRTSFAGTSQALGALTYVTSDYDGLDYNSLQVSAQRRLAHGLQMGGAYTLAKGMGMRGWDFRTEELGGAAALKAALLRTADCRRTRVRSAATWRSSTTATRSPRSTSPC